ncbi:hypothetical protein H6F78_04125 [Coleofasciculus sp. FACHB-64]|uniref:hypothetical protein n=1 Tax=Cyanophyceae TaxID=3028117 RepID=UPI0016827179|nr:MULTISPECIES: hypothetical protein [unclassified Coleofasciculus]MBD1837290.1 hypothetical protein [Coleofasciculus sp. FACHB-501]MBD2044826.1 hypothetical protein [Coleofasciculus sp. FACHB-64]
MDSNKVRDFAERFKKFYYYRALLCEKLINSEVVIRGHMLELSPPEFNPFQNLSVEAYVVGFAALDGLSSVWQALSTPTTTKIGNQQRFVSFLLNVKVEKYLDRVSTPFLNYFLKKDKIEEPFTQEIQNQWVNNRKQNESHRVYCDPTIDQLKDLYINCHKHNTIPPEQIIKDIDAVLTKFTYAALIYKYYRCPFVHEFRASQYAACFNQGQHISVREIFSDISPSGKVIPRDEVKPQLDVGISVLTESIKKGADIVYDLIIEKQLTDIPYSSSDEIDIAKKVKRSKDDCP